MWTLYSRLTSNKKAEQMNCLHQLVFQHRADRGSAGNGQEPEWVVPLDHLLGWGIPIEFLEDASNYTRIPILSRADRPAMLPL